MPVIPSGDAEIFYQVIGQGPTVVLLHAFPVNHQFWLPVAHRLASHYRMILPDLRGHGRSSPGEGPASMEKHAADLARLLDHAEVSRAALMGASLGGYVLFEFWRRDPQRFAALGLWNTKAQSDSGEAKAGREKAAEDVLERGTAPFFESMLPKLMGRSTHASRPDLVEGALAMMHDMSRGAVAQVQRGMASRPDSGAILKTIHLPTLVITGEEDGLTGPSEAEFLHRNIGGSQLRVIARAGHYAPWEQPEPASQLLRQFLDSSLDRGGTH
jgi:pimeloyl-ACP methyl ester carboxylesterase